MSRLTLIMTAAIVTGCSTTGWRAQKIDGSSPSTLEVSVVSLQQSLPSRRRAELETALAVIWLRNAAVGAGDLDSDGRVDLNEVRALQAAAEDVLTDLKRGVFVASIQEGADTAGGYAKQLNGLGYDAIIRLADPTSGDVFADAVRQQRAESRCSGVRQVPGSSAARQESIKSPVISRYCARQ
jgi:hypothetical protein